MYAPSFRAAVVTTAVFCLALAWAGRPRAATPAPVVPGPLDKRVSAPRPLVAADVYLRTEAGREIGRANALTPATPVYSQWYQHSGAGGPFALHARWAGREFYRVGTARECLLSLLWWFNARRAGGDLPPLG